MTTEPLQQQEIIELAVSAGTSALIRFLKDAPGTTTVRFEDYTYDITVRRREVNRPPPNNSPHKPH